MSLRQRAREAYARQFDKRGSAYANTAASLRSGFENIWISPAIDALEAVLRLVPDDDESDPKARRT